LFFVFFKSMAAFHSEIAKNFDVCVWVTPQGTSPYLGARKVIT
jgi:hypothetical protein